MARTLLNAILAVLLLACGAPGAPAAALLPPAPDRAVQLLNQRLQQWPQWRLPAPLPRPAGADLTYPDWFAGAWQVSSQELPLSPATAAATAIAEAPEASTGEPTAEAPAGEPLLYPVRFQRNASGALVGDRAYNAAAVGRALFGAALRSVRNDPADPNRQLAELAGGRLLESRVLGRLSGSTADGAFLSDELSLQILHGPQQPRVSRVEILSRWRWHPGAGQDRGWIEAEQWQASYPSPAEGLTARAAGASQRRLRLEPPPPAPDPAS